VEPLSNVLTDGQYSAVYNMLSFGLASMLFTSLFLILSRERVLPRYRTAVTVSAMVTGIAAYHYWRMFNSFSDAYQVGGNPGAYNVGYRYIDWLLTVPLLLVETIAVLALARSAQRALLGKLVPAAALMIALGYPGDANLQVWGGGVSEIAIWGALSTVPFLYILYVLFVELGKSLERQPAEVAATIGRLRLLLIATWGVYPISYLFNMMNFGEQGIDTGAFVTREIGYSIADVLAKCMYGLVIYKIARVKSAIDSAEFADAEFKEAASSAVR
jgi:bacteriorhodopsin